MEIAIIILAKQNTLPAKAQTLCYSLHAIRIYVCINIWLATCQKKEFCPVRVPGTVNK